MPLGELPLNHPSAQPTCRPRKHCATAWPGTVQLDLRFEVDQRVRAEGRVGVHPSTRRRLFASAGPCWRRPTDPRAQADGTRWLMKFWHSARSPLMAPSQAS